LKRLFALGIVVTAAFASLAFGATRGGAGLLGCSGYSYTQPFTAWGDGASYSLAPGGSFEGANTWGLSWGAQIAVSNEPFFLNSPSDSHSLVLQPGSSATSPPMCLGTLDPKFRLVGKVTGATAVHVDVYARGLFGLIRIGTGANMAVSSSWDASAPQTLLLDNVLALTNLGTTQVVFKFSPVGSSTAQLDDVYVDPIFHE
jgi:hypothetical protein